MRPLNKFFLVAALLSCSVTPVLAHDDISGSERPVHLSFRYMMDGPLYDKLAKEFREETFIEEMPDDVPLLGVHEEDLNGDGNPEYIVRITDTFFKCNNIGCHHGVVAITGDEVKRLGYFEYAELDVSIEETDGVKDLLVYDNVLNDFAPTVYKWDAQKQMYLEN